MAKSNLNSRILLISDLHCPHQHPDAVKFLAALQRKYKFTRIVCLGDEVDAAALSYHEKNPDLPSAGNELQQAIKALTPLYKLFPKVDVVESNHGALHKRKAMTAGIPQKYLRGYNEILDAPNGWHWHRNLDIVLPNGNRLHVTHGASANVSSVVARRGECVAQGHFHSKFEIVYAGNPASLLWGVTAACLINRKSAAFAYDRGNLARPIIGCAAVVNSLPILLPMTLSKNGRWNGVCP